MAVVTYDEAVDIVLYRFLSFLRLLMHYHPRVGAGEYAQYLGLQTSLVPGWNAVQLAAGGEVPMRYIYISSEGGKTTDVPPVIPKEDIHVVKEEDLPPFEGSPAWQQFIQLAEMMVERKHQGIDSAWVQKRIDIVKAKAVTPLRGVDKHVDDTIAQAFAWIRDNVNGPNGSILSFTEPITNVVNNCLSFRLTVTQASNIIAVLLAYYAIKYASPLDRTTGVKLVQQQIDHLISLVSTIIQDRQLYDLGAYTQLSYLGLLWAETALLMAKQLATRSPTEDLSHWFERRGLYVDELAVHNLAPSLLHPISLAPFGTVEYLRARNVGILNLKGLYTGAGEIGHGPIVPEDVWARVQEYSASRKRLGTNYGAYEDFLTPTLVEHLTGFVLTMKLGQLY